MPRVVTRDQRQRGHGRRLALAGFAALLVSCLEVGAQQASSPGPWIPFEGSWQVTGTKQTLPTGERRPAAILHFGGAVLLTSGEGLSRGFFGEAIGFDDGQHVSVGRSVLTDEHGDHIFAVIGGDPVAAGRRLAGTITGGTGRYAGLSGEFTLEWQYVVESEEGAIEARGVRFEGRYRRAVPPPTVPPDGEAPR